MTKKQINLSLLARSLNLVVTCEIIRCNLKSSRIKVDRKSILTVNYHTSKLAKGAKNRQRIHVSEKLHKRINLSLYKELILTKDIRAKKAKRQGYKEYYQYKHIDKRIEQNIPISKGKVYPLSFINK